MKSNNKLTGKRGEGLATEFLENKGYFIVERNFSTRFGELDIVCLDGEILVFVEVKTKIGHDFGEPEEMVNKTKLGQVQHMGEVYIELKTQELKKSKTQDSEFKFMDSRLRGNDKLTDLRQNRHCEFPRSGTEAIPATLDFAQSSEIATVRSTETRNDGRQKWSGRCRVDVVGIVLNGDLDVERIRHYEAVY